ncbi:relaxase/mobilization nuclease domain-containing protein [Listeria innocua]|uniref:relaxase/mobilization nuclease domain-containing protein n=1 Tax=Listeria innocua TaxID=1642 RepID=UPI00162885FE|nr:relaxase/mobilization nuclease domain-containing protein [Listeria innocua]MBC2135332.1 relaxase/mobilization nuclease domain-containing protein [Listeria innocua]
MVVSSIKPIKKSVGAYQNYIFGQPHNGKKERNLIVLGVGNCENMSSNNMSEVLKLEREAFPSKTRKNDAYTLVIAFSDELDPNNSNDWKKAGNITKEIVEAAYPNRSAMIAVQKDGKSGLLHTHVLLNNVDAEGKALRKNGWKHLKNVTDMVAKKNGLNPLTEKKDSESKYDWRKDLAHKIKMTSGDSSSLAEIGITMKIRNSKKYPPAVTSFSFTDREGKKRNIRGRKLASQLNIPADTFDIKELQKLKTRQSLILDRDDVKLDLQDLNQQIELEQTHTLPEISL